MHLPYSPSQVFQQTIYESSRIPEHQLLGLQKKQQPSGSPSMLRLDYLSCALTILSTCLVSRRMWQGWVVAAANSVIICIIGFRTAQFGFVPANLFCLALYSTPSTRGRVLQNRRLRRAKSASHMFEAVREGGSFTIRIFGQSGITRGARVRSSASSTRVPASDEQSARNSDRVLSRPLPARP